MTEKKCVKCGEVKKVSEFYGRNDKKDGLNSYCKYCFLELNKNSWRVKKLEAINYLGGKCLDCRQELPYQVYQFHHRDPNQKEYTWNKGRLKSWDVLVKELDKCDLLCANCHILRHSERLCDEEVKKLLEQRDNRELIRETAKQELITECPTCGKDVPGYKQYCSPKCSGESRQRIDWGSFDLQELISSFGGNISAVGRHLGVSGNAVRKHIK